MDRYIGIDYGMGTTNVDTETGIRYGVICVHDLNEFAWDSFESDYGEPTCGHCGNEVVEYDEEKHGEYEPSRDRGCCCDYACENCEIYLGSDEVYGEEPVGHYLDDGEYKAFLDEHNDVMILKSPYFTHCQFCSPCAPGAGHLGNPRSADSGAPKTYCFGPDWFNNDEVPYDVYSVETGELVQKAWQPDDREPEIEG